MAKSISEVEEPLKYFSWEWFKFAGRCIVFKGYANDGRLGAVDLVSSGRTASWTFSMAYINAKYPLVLKFAGAVLSKIWGFLVATAVVARDLVSALWHSVI